LVGLLPEIYLSLIILVGLFIVAGSNFSPKATIIEKKKKVTPFVYNTILFGFIGTLVFYVFLNPLG